jgi:hypothetical protein
MNRNWINSTVYAFRRKKESAAAAGGGQQWSWLIQT